MRQKLLLIATLITTLQYTTFLLSCNEIKNSKIKNEESEEHERYDGPALAAKQMFDAMKDPATGKVPMDKFWAAIEYTDQLKQDLRSRNYANAKTTGLPAWTERGPNSDATGASNGNTRANSGVASGRVRAIWVDLADATGNTVWVGGIDGGLWKTTSITSAPAGWVPINDRFNNLAITSICQDPTNTNIMYFSTGESLLNIDAVNGVGVFKSIDHGATWTLLPSTSTYVNCYKILCDASGNVFLATQIGLFRSLAASGGSSWANITPSGISSTRISDIEISSTGRLHMSSGDFTTCDYRFTDIPSTVAAGTWTSATSGYPTSSVRIELGCKGKTLYALPSNSSYQVPTIYKSLDGGATWAATAGQPTSGWASGQAWYALAVAINPSDSTQIIVGGLDCYKSTNGGSTWSQISTWVGTSGQYTHADKHSIVWANSGSTLLIGCDGGVHFSSNGGTTIVDKNVGLRIKQFYSCDLNPTSGSNIALAGAQDNGCHQFSVAGLGATTEVTGGDGCYVHIDQNQGQYMFGSYVYNNYRMSSNTGSSWSSINFYTNIDGQGNPVQIGQFVNPSDYDDIGNIFYSCGNSGYFFRWTTPQTTSSGSYYENTNSPAFPASALQVPLTGIGTVNAITVNPYKNTTVYFANQSGNVYKVYNANTTAGGAVGINLSTGLPAGSIHCIAFGSDSNHIAVTYTNYGINNVWLSTNGGTSWTAQDNNLPDMPVWWALFDPTSDTKMILGTETGVWGTKALSGGTTNWTADPLFPNVSTQMLKMRTSDNMVAAATHGRGLWTGVFADIIILPFTEFDVNAVATNGQTEVKWKYSSHRTGIKFEVQTSDDGINFKTQQTINQINSGIYAATLAQGNFFIRIKATDLYGYTEYSKTVKVAEEQINLTISNLYPNPALDYINITANIPNNKQKVFFKILDMAGRTVIDQNNNNNYGVYNTVINLKSLPSGQYIFIADNGIDKIERKIIKL